MTDEMLARALQRYADERVRPFDPVAIAAAAVATPDRPARPQRIARGRTRAVVLAFAAALVVLTTALVVAWVGGQPTPRTKSDTASPAPQPSPRADALLAGTWLLDFRSSGLDPRVNPDLDRDIGSSLRFSHGGFFGSMGYGGGCANFDGTFAATPAVPSSLAGEIQFSLTALHQTCGEGVPQRVVESLVGGRRYQLMDCDPVPGSSDPEDLFCRTLRIGDEIDTNVLVYRRDVQG